MLCLAACLLLAVSAANAAPQLDFDQIFGNGNSSSCPGEMSVAGYCCPGSIINPSGNFMNNNNQDVSGIICCVGDPNHAFNNGGVSTCSAGSAVPLTEAATASAPAGSGPAASPANQSAVASASMDSGMAQSSTAGSSQATQTSGGGSGGSGSAESRSAASSGVATQSSAGGAGAVMATLAPVLGGAVIGLTGCL